MLKKSSTLENSFEIDKNELRQKWIDEIIRETEHYFQGEIQHDQRASWLLATSGAMIAVIIGIAGTTIDQTTLSTRLHLLTCLIAFILCAITSLFMILPMRGLRSLWKDFVGSAYRIDQQRSIDDLIQSRFHMGKDWSYEGYETRIKYHFRSHYLRYNKKSYGILWASVFLIAGLFTSLLTILDFYL